ncbi:prephenate dehydratase domain-containing protein [Kitasatospora sp. NBC_01302]|uniref:prephenate dehydratase domain-containing protein n=1 Tax=Kitasatospora sp. NBC_01302 TaxID=2903575 RepID=UPI002E1312BC|nr:hypothetical protein OG294_01470 [Kitasatospora sp. NBC_01302]
MVTTAASDQLAAEHRVPAGHGAWPAGGVDLPGGAGDLLTREIIRHRPARLVGTLGPQGTSSEEAAGFLWDRLHGGAPKCEPQVGLYDTYEQAGNALRSGEISHVVIANAYARINEFYMDTRIALAAAFVLETPLYGIARDLDHKVPAVPVVATHPAPVPLVDQLLPARYTGRKITLTPSTSAAARAVRERTADLALTTEPAADRYGLRFISRTRTIQMVWSVFVAEDAQQHRAHHTRRDPPGSH